MSVRIPTEIFSTFEIGAYAFSINELGSWNKVAFTKSSGFPSNGSTIKSLVSWYRASDGLIKKSWGLINSIFHYIML